MTTIYDCVQINDAWTYHSPRSLWNIRRNRWTECGRRIPDWAAIGQAAPADDPNWCKTCLRVIEKVAEVAP